VKRFRHNKRDELLQEAAESLGYRYFRVDDRYGRERKTLEDMTGLSTLPPGWITKRLLSQRPDQAVQLFEAEYLGEPSPALTHVCGLARLSSPSVPLILRRGRRRPSWPALRRLRAELDIFGGAYRKGLGPMYEVPFGNADLDERFILRSTDPMVAGKIRDDRTKRSWLLGIKEDWTFEVVAWWLLVTRRGELVPDSIPEALSILNSAHQLAYPASATQAEPTRAASPRPRARRAVRGRSQGDRWSSLDRD
jgi:hypothetical protein